jgi:hypothetical protein
MQRILNILRVYHRASAFEIDAGLRWYFTAHEEAKRLGNRISSLPGTIHPILNERTLRGAAIIAAVSPGLRWERNIEAAERIIDGIGLEGLGVRWYDGVKKAQAILSGQPIDEVLKGNKVRSFFANIAKPDNDKAVTIDGHAYAIWSAERKTLDETPGLSDSLYERIASDYRYAAEQVCVLPHQLQAITWTTWRRLHGVNSGHYLPLFEESVW